MWIRACDLSLAYHRLEGGEIYAINDIFIHNASMREMVHQRSVRMSLS